MFKNNKNLYLLFGILLILIITNISLHLISNEKYSDFNNKPHFYYNYYEFRERDLYNKILNLDRYVKDFSKGEDGDNLKNAENDLKVIDTLTGSGIYSIRNSINELETEFSDGDIYIQRMQNGF
tara:strand:+ start:211 stop:582 length:372 start_codon:yes stop_codon:yes gene_type:complete